MNRYVAIAPGRIEDHQKLGPASYLHDFLVDHQTDAAGKVNYGRAISYAWIRAHWKDAPTKRTLVRYMNRLKASSLVAVRRLPRYRGMTVRVLGSVKWPGQRQLPLFPPLSISSGKAVRKLLNQGNLAVTELAPQAGLAVTDLSPKSIKK